MRYLAEKAQFDMDLVGEHSRPWAGDHLTSELAFSAMGTMAQGTETMCYHAALQISRGIGRAGRHS